MTAGTGAAPGDDSSAPVGRGAMNVVSTAEECRLLPDGAPWSVEFLIESGHRDYVEERMAQAGVTLSDIPELRAAAVTHSE